MSGGSAENAAQRAAAGAGRLVRAWRNLPHERRLAAYAAIGLVLALFLPWYQETVIASSKATHLQSLTASITGWGAFSFVEAAVLLVAVGVLTLLFQRAEGRAFHLPGGDGWVIMFAGLWTCLLIVWRIFDKQGTSVHGPGATTSGVEWGIFVALAVAAFLTYAGSRIRAAHRPEPPLPGEADRPQPPEAAAAPRPARGAARWPRPVAAKGPRTRPSGWDDPPAWEDSAGWRDPPAWGGHRTRRGVDERPATTGGSADEGATEATAGAGDPTGPIAGDEAPTVRMPEPSTRAARMRSPGQPDEWPTAPDERPTDPVEPRTIPLEPDGGEG
jgi:hypothetical protein